MLGSEASDPRSFAAAWAAERGVIHGPSHDGRGVLRRALVVAALGAFTPAALVGGVLVIGASPPGSTRLALAVPPVAGLPGEPAMAVVRVPAPPPGTPLTVTVDGRSLPDTVWVVPAPATRIVAVDADDSGGDTRSAGWVLLAVGLAGLASATMVWLSGGLSGRHRVA